MSNFREVHVSYTKVNLEMYASADKYGSAASAVRTQFNDIFRVMVKIIQFYMKDV
jgi:hypothetical protein